MSARRSLQWSEGAAAPVLDQGARDGWRDDAACRSADPETFFPVVDDGAAIREAKAICTGCPARGECLGFAVTSGRERGVWGGELFGEAGTIIRAGVTGDPADPVLRSVRAHRGPNLENRLPGKCRNRHRRTEKNTRRLAPTPEYPYGKIVCRDCENARSRKRRQVAAGVAA